LKYEDWDIKHESNTRDFSFGEEQHNRHRMIHSIKSLILDVKGGAVWMVINIYNRPRRALSRK